MKEVFQANDGTIFETPDGATRHESDQMQEWLETSIVGSWVAEVLETMDDDAEDEYYGTQRDIGVQFRDAAYRLSLTKAEEFPSKLAEFVDTILGTDDEEVIPVESSYQEYIDKKESFTLEGTIPVKDETGFVRSEN